LVASSKYSLSISQPINYNKTVKRIRRSLALVRLSAIYFVYAGGIASFNSLNPNQLIPYASGAFFTVFGFIPSLNLNSLLALLAVVTNSGICE
jgi:hypothetical protein